MKLLRIILSIVTIGALPVAARAAEDYVRIRVINAFQPVPIVSVAFGNTPAFHTVQFKQITPWVNFPEVDDQPLRITFADGRQLQTTKELSFDDDDDQYTILVTPDLTGLIPSVAVLKTDDDKADKDEVELMLINAAPEHRSLKLTLGDKTLERAVQYARSVNDDVKAGPQTLQIIDSDRNMAIATQYINLRGGTQVTVVAMGGGMLRIIEDAYPDYELSITATPVVATTPLTVSRPDAATTVKSY